MENGGKRCRKAHCLILPYPLQGHINPMLQFSKRLHQKGSRVTLVVTRFMLKTMHQSFPGSVAVETISDGFDEYGRVAAGSLEIYLKKFREAGRETLTQLLEKLEGQGFPVDCIVYDPLLPWGLDLAKKFGIFGAAFLTQSCAVGNIYFHIQKEILRVPFGDDEDEILVPGLPPMKPRDMPSFAYDYGSYPNAFDLLLNQFSNIQMADCVFCNTFYELEQQVVDWLATVWPLRTIGPTIPSVYVDGRLQEDKDYGLSLFSPDATTCRDWLDRQQPRTVVYASFGSLAQLGAQQTEELAIALKHSKRNFLWIVRPEEESKIPAGFEDETAGKGLVVRWCRQLEVLSHAAVGCFVTHGGWNSTLEALSLGVAAVVLPQWTDQSANAKCLMDVWEAGVWAEADAEGVVRRDVIEDCLREVMEGERGREIRRNVMKWKDLARKATDEEGSSDRNIEEFVSQLVRRNSLNLLTNSVSSV